LYDVVIIGSGPAGSYLAYRLTKTGHRVLVLEKNHEVGQRVCCTGIIGTECAGLYDIPDDIILRRVNSARLYSPSGEILHLWREETQACILDRVAFEKELARRAQEGGAEYEMDSLAGNPSVSGDGISIEISNHHRKPGVKAKAIVIATGFGSGLTEKMGLGKPADFTVGAQAEEETDSIDEVEVYFGKEVSPGFFGWAVPTSPGRVSVGLMTRRNPALYLRRLLASLASRGKITSSEADFRLGTIPLKPLPKTFGEHLLVVGDAAGQVKPTSGGGIFYGSLCADIAAGILHEALESNDFSADNLSRYERLWRKKLGMELKTGYWARKFFERMSDSQIDRLFRTISEHGIEEDLSQTKDLSFDWHGKALIRLLRYRAITGILGIKKLLSQRK